MDTCCRLAFIGPHTLSYGPIDTFVVCRLSCFQTYLSSKGDLAHTYIYYYNIYIRPFIYILLIVVVGGVESVENSHFDSIYLRRFSMVDCWKLVESLLKTFFNTIFHSRFLSFQQSIVSSMLNFQQFLEFSTEVFNSVEKFSTIRYWKLINCWKLNPRLLKTCWKLIGECWKLTVFHKVFNTPTISVDA